MKHKLLIIALLAFVFFSCKKTQDLSSGKDVKKSEASTKPPFPNKDAETFATENLSSTKKTLNQVIFMDVEFGNYNDVTGTTHVKLNADNGGYIGTQLYALYTPDNTLIKSFGYHSCPWESDMILPIGTYVFVIGDNISNPTYGSKPFTVAAKPPTPPNGLLNLYRYYNPVFNRHFYSTNWADIGSNGDGYQFEKVQGYLYANPGSDRVPLYEYYNNSTNDHWYTTNSTGWPGYVSIGIIGYIPTYQTSDATLALDEYYGNNTGHVYTSPGEDMSSYTFSCVVGYLIPYYVPPVPQAIYQFYSPSGKDHFASPDASIASTYAGWTSLGIDFKAYLIPMSGTSPVYEFYNSQGQDHYTSINPNAVNGYAGWVNNGVKFYAYTNSNVPGTIPIYLFIDGANLDHYLTSNPNATNGYSGWISEGVVFYAFPK